MNKKAIMLSFVTTICVGAVALGFSGFSNLRVSKATVDNGDYYSITINVQDITRLQTFKRMLVIWWLVFTTIYVINIWIFRYCSIKLLIFLIQKL